ncbi:hypothetical protein BDZ45DRAFT_678049 [Acephala macrosclerotiorum]|nr:hypothetical protein BDZ45DRAFT_678049 [Acephala macrosclerotiorum]
MQSPHSPLSNHTQHVKNFEPKIPTQNQHQKSPNQHPTPTQSSTQNQHQHQHNSTSSFRRHTIDASHIPRPSKAILLWTGRREKWHFASLTGVPTQKHHFITHRHPLRHRADITRDMLMWNWKDAVMFRTQVPVVEDVDPFVVVDRTEDGSVKFAGEAWISYGNQKDRPGWKGNEDDSDFDTMMDSDDDGMTVVGDDFGDPEAKEPYIIIHHNKGATLRYQFAAIDLSPGRLKSQEIHELKSKIARWSSLLSDERQLIQGISAWLESLIPSFIFNISPCGQPPNLSTICTSSPSTCPLCLIRCLKPHPEWHFLFPILEESATRLENGAYALRDLEENLIALEGGEGRGCGQTSARHPRDIPEPPPPQRLTRKMEAQISEAELRVGKMRTEIAMEQSTILPG